MNDDLDARLERWQKHFGQPMGPGRANPDNDLIYLLDDLAKEIKHLRSALVVHMLPEEQAHVLGKKLAERAGLTDTNAYFAVYGWREGRTLSADDIRLLNIVLDEMNEEILRSGDAFGMGGDQMLAELANHAGVEAAEIRDALERESQAHLKEILKKAQANAIERAQKIERKVNQ